MIMMTLRNIKKSFGSEILFDGISFNIEHNSKIGLVGVNGAGKTTLFKIINKRTSYDEGELFINKNTTIGYMKQNLVHNSSKTVWQELMTVFEKQKDIEKELEEIRLLIESQNGDINTLVNRQHLLQQQYESLDGFVYKSKAKGALIGLGFSEKDFDLNFDSLSGGQKTRVMLCKILLGNSNLLLLDEPTNHLDISSVEWLESFLKAYKGAYIVISHDRYFLYRVTSKTFELENNSLTVYEGNYSVYVEKKAQLLEAARKQYSLNLKEIERVEGIIEQQRRWGREKNIKTAESKQKQVERMENELVRPPDDPLGINFQFNTKKGRGNDVLMAASIKKSFDEKKLFENVDIDIKRGERVFLLGSNGCGKTTLLKILLGEMAADSGEFNLGANITTGYYDQTQQGLDKNKQVIDEIWDEFPKMTQTEIRNALAVFLFKGDDVFKSVSALSGGERARVLLLKLMLSSANFLILDEPTNHLDISSKEALENALKNYNGTLLIVSHDRYFINKTADKIYELKKDGAKLYSGDYDYFLEKSSVVTEEIKPAVNEYKAKKEIKSNQKKQENMIKRLENEIINLEAEQEKLKENLVKPEIAANYQELVQIMNEIELLSKQIDEKYEELDNL